MASNKRKTVFVCSDCGNESAKWYGKCPSCGGWDKLYETEAVPETPSRDMPGFSGHESEAQALSELDLTDEIRLKTGFGELDRVLGGGAVIGSLVLIGGEPGIGKSTLMLQICKSLGENGRVLYASGEESKRQIRLRADRLDINDGNILVLAETNLDTILKSVVKTAPAALVVDSIQTVYRPGLNSAPGNVSQIKECTMALLRLAKESGILVFIVGHVNKEGEIAGPKILEHMVDCVLYFEGEHQNTYRILRAAKNRFGSTNEIGVFEMGAAGLAEVPNPSAALLAGRPEGAPGSCITCALEGTRPILAEIQALVTPSVFGNPRRMSAGVDFNRAVLMLAVLEKRAGIRVSNADVYINVIGGLRIDEPASDLSIAVAIASSCLDAPVRRDAVVFGEVGLTGELRRVTSLEQRFSETARLKIKRCVCPALGELPPFIPAGLEIIRVASVMEAIRVCLE